jgi:hypothetical protein
MTPSTDGHVARPLRDFPPPQLAFLLQLRQRLVHHRQQLEDDRGRDVRHDAQGEDRQPAQVAAAEQIDETQRRAGLVIEETLQRLDVDARRGDVRAQPVDRQNAHGEQHTPAQVGDPEDI